MNLPFEKHGYKAVEVIHNTQRNAAYKVIKNDNYYFAKVCLTKEPIKLENDVWWSLTMSRLAGPSAAVMTPKMHEYGYGWFVSEFIDKPLLVDHGWNHGSEQFNPHIQRLTETLIWLDQAIIPQKVNDDYDLTNSSPYNNLMKKVDGWLKEPLKSGITSKQDYEAAVKLIDEFKDNLKPSFQHGDFVPWHIFDLGSKVCLFDGEHAGLAKPRYYDLAYLYSRLYTRSNAVEAARGILRQFIKQGVVNKDDFFAVFLPVITLRALGMQADANNDLAKFDYTDSARDILRRCLERNIGALVEA
jgi:hypothetical protein